MWNEDGAYMGWCNRWLGDQWDIYTSRWRYPVVLYSTVNPQCLPTSLSALLGKNREHVSTPCTGWLHVHFKAAVAEGTPNRGGAKFVDGCMVVVRNVAGWMQRCAMKLSGILILRTNPVFNALDNIWYVCDVVLAIGILQFLVDHQVFSRLTRSILFHFPFSWLCRTPCSHLDGAIYHHGGPHESQKLECADDWKTN